MRLGTGLAIRKAIEREDVAALLDGRWLLHDPFWNDSRRLFGTADPAHTSVFDTAG